MLKRLLVIILLAIMPPGESTINKYINSILNFKYGFMGTMGGKLS